MLKDAAFALWFLLPAGIANMTPILAAVTPGLRRLDTPIDFGKRYRGIFVLGPHKTWRGLITGTLMAVPIFWLQQLAYSHYGWAHTFAHGVDYASLPLLLGPALGFGALVGDSVESFFKRQRRVPAGDGWFPFDQLDYILGSLLFSLPFIVLSGIQYVFILVVWFLMHLLFSYLGWLTGLKASPI